MPRATMTELLMLAEERKRARLEAQMRQKALIDQLFNSGEAMTVVSFEFPEACVKIIESWCEAKGISPQEFYSNAIREKASGLVVDVQTNEAVNWQAGENQ